MTDIASRAKQGIRCLAGDRMRCSSCPYSRPGNLQFMACVKDIALDTLQAFKDHTAEINSLKKALDESEHTVYVEVPVEKERKGIWFYDNQGHYFCSECGFMENTTVKLKIRKYCPVCGAKMEKEQV